MAHTKEFYIKKYEEIKEYLAEKGVPNPYNNLTSFISDYESIKEDGSKNVMREIKYYAQYETSYKTARGMLAKVREFGGTERLGDLKSMSTRDFAEKYLGELKKAQAEAAASYSKDNSSLGGFTPKEWIGVWWFGS